MTPARGGPAFAGGPGNVGGGLLGLTGLTLGILALNDDGDDAGGGPPSSPFSP